jgi:hypothetical protein
LKKKTLVLLLKMNKEQPHYVANPKAIEGNIKSQKVIKRILENFKMENSDPEKLLSILLGLRYDFLDNRHKIITSIRERIIKARNDPLKNQSPEIGRPIYGPTNPKYFEELNPHAQFLARSSTDRYQSINKLIITIWQLINPRSLKAQTKLQVRCATTLWANLIGERDYLGHPDEAIMPYNDEFFPFNKDYENYDSYLKEWRVEIKLLRWQKSQQMVTSWTPYQRSLWDEEWENYGKLEDAPYPDWLKPLPQNFSKPEVLAVGRKPTEQVSKPASVKKKKSRKPPKAENNHKSRVIHKAGQREPETRVISAVEIKLPDLLILSPLDDPENSIISEDAKTQPHQDILEDGELGFDVEGKESEEAITSCVSEEPEETENEENVVSHSSPRQDDSLRPQGMRMFHGQQNVLSENLIITPLKGKLEKIRQKVFHPKQFQNVSFGKFKTLWKHICGEYSVIESTGSSHKKLIGPRGEVFGTYAHGDSMTYGQKTIKYIRDALTQIGYGD